MPANIVGNRRACDNQQQQCDTTHYPPLYIHNLSSPILLPKVFKFASRGDAREMY
jgi:hypothetical protein